MINSQTIINFLGRLLFPLCFLLQFLQEGVRGKYVCVCVCKGQRERERLASSPAPHFQLFNVARRKAGGGAGDEAKRDCINVQCFG